MTVSPGPQDDERERMVSEVLELGEALFDAVVEEASLRGRDQGEAAEAVLLDDARAAAEAFFDALRLLFGRSDNPTDATGVPRSGTHQSEVQP